MSEVEPIIVTVAIEKGKINHPLICKEGLQLANQIIARTSTELKVIAFKKKRNCCRSEKVNNAELGVKYWKGFLRRNEEIFWQVGDSAEVNGALKMSSYERKAVVKEKE